MSQSYSTGEVAKLAGVTVRTVQYYDQKGILSPNDISEGGRRIYSEEDLRNLQVIVFLRELDFSLDQIRRFMAEESADKTLELLLQEHISDLQKERNQLKSKLDMSVNLLDKVKSQGSTSLESLADISLTMKNQKAWRKLQWKMWALWLLLVLLLTGLSLWLGSGAYRWIILPLVVVYLIIAICMANWYRSRVAYLCPNCHQTFEPSFKEFTLAAHTPKTRRLTCPHCHRKSYCLELAKEKE
ncbi:MerR family transcriptional regulator [Streptococcus loxodontisalivarius]|uniref:DNA-binding transcriptional MerR regulator/DNA-directed RNA polymerase subunit RPC12/RpoP n=1 Tax=Streptococcus loxodontisalivarius TaxID=1349415 RepID=A0ABS2PPG5_9STRE|nr:MerR family transcriptional regulator [Streptococcus loxodontisalivarius]MBM7641924.1 DNA-binding transcriptional MerR regulator/DNA-directed RNA polymerase subunit RPC12/RpoP [Streptococcus loxodontisalivarius]